MLKSTINIKVQCQFIGVYPLWCLRLLVTPEFVTMLPEGYSWGGG